MSPPSTFPPPPNVVDPGGGSTTAWPAQRVALEVDGGTGSYGRHSRPGGQRGDHEKANTAQLMGWRVLRVSSPLRTRLATLELIREALKTP